MKKILFFLLLSLNGMLYSQERINLNENDLISKEVTLRSNKQSVSAENSKRLRQFTMNKALLDSRNIKSGDIILLHLFEDKKYEAIVENAAANELGVFLITAKIKEYPMSYVLISSENSRSFLLIDIPELSEKYTIRGGVDSKTPNYLVELSPVDIKCPGDIEADGVLNTEQASQVLTRNIIESRKGVNDHAQIDLLVVYTKEAEKWINENEGGVNIFRTNLTNMCNLVLQNSQVGITINVVDFKKIIHNESSIGLDLGRLRDPADGYMDDVHELRVQKKADLVMLIGLYSILDASGIAYLLNNTGGRPDSGFSVMNVRFTLASYIVVHELGHNLGLGHHKQQITQPGPGIFPYSAGWRWKGPDNNMYCSIMTYGTSIEFPDKLSATVIPYFSNPNIIQYGASTGHPTEADAARSLRETKHVVAAYSENLVPSCVDVNEPNDNIEQATTIYYSEIGGIASGTDFDFYKFTLSKPSYVTITLEGRPYEHEINLYDPNGYYVRIGDIKNNMNIIEQSFESGTYYVRVAARYKSSYIPTSCYKLTVSKTEISPSSCIYNYEPNDSRYYATAINLNTTYSAGLTNYLDRDYYKFTLNTTSNVRINFQKNNLPNYYLALSNAQGVIVDACGSVCDNKNIAMDNLAPGTYYLYVSGLSCWDLTSCYQVRVETSTTRSFNSKDIDFSTENLSDAILYPNPVTDILNVKNIDMRETGVTQVQILDVSGNMLKNIEVRNEDIIKIDVSDLPNNIYLLRIKDRTYKFSKK